MSLIGKMESLILSCVRDNWNVVEKIALNSILPKPDDYWGFDSRVDFPIMEYFWCLGNWGPLVLKNIPDGDLVLWLVQWLVKFLAFYALLTILLLCQGMYHVLIYVR
uniref:Uncharacterized protein n=1 Tax=Rhizophora mucronata TaxID=61149 RepID=A0A2P2QUQ9_RHIMU